TFLLLALLSAEMGCQRSVPTPTGALPEKQGDVLQASDTPEVILEKATQASGGIEKLTGWRVGYVKYAGRFPPFMDVAAKGEDYFDFPGRHRRVVIAEKDGEEFF